MKKFFKDFGAFINRGNVIDLAVGMIMGTAFGKIVSSLVNDILMPIISLAVGANVKELYCELKPATVILADGTTQTMTIKEMATCTEEFTVKTTAVKLSYGNFIQTIIDFLLIALTVFIIVKIFMFLSNRRQRLQEKLLKNDEESNEEVAKD